MNSVSQRGGEGQLSWKRTVPGSRFQVLGVGFSAAGFPFLRKTSGFSHRAIFARASVHPARLFDPRRTLSPNENLELGTWNLRKDVSVFKGWKTLPAPIGGRSDPPADGSKTGLCDRRCTPLSPGLALHLLPRVGPGLLRSNPAGDPKRVGRHHVPRTYTLQPLPAPPGSSISECRVPAQRNDHSFGRSSSDLQELADSFLANAVPCPSPAGVKSTNLPLLGQDSKDGNAVRSPDHREKNRVLAGSCHRPGGWVSGRIESRFRPLPPPDRNEFAAAVPAVAASDPAF